MKSRFKGRIAPKLTQAEIDHNATFIKETYAEIGPICVKRRFGVAFLRTGEEQPVTVCSRGAMRGPLEPPAKDTRHRVAR